MKKEIFGALVRIGMVTINASIADAQERLGHFFAGQGRDTPATEDEQLKLLNEYIAGMQAREQAKAATPATPIAGTATQTVTLQPGTLARAADAGDRSASILAAVRISSLPEASKFAFANELIAAKGADGQPITVEAALNRIHDKAAAASPPTGATIVAAGQAEQDKFHVEARDAILLASFNGARPQQIYNYQTGAYEDWKPSRSVSYGLTKPMSLARQCLMVAGVPARRVENIAPMHIAQLVIGGDPRHMGLGALFAGDGAAYNTTSMFSNIFLDAQNVSLRRSFDDSRTTFQLWARRGEDAADFKDINRVIAGELGDPRAIPEDGEFEETTLLDGKEKYKLTVWGEIFSRPWQMIVNDRLGAFMDVEGRMGNAMKRKINRLAYQVLKDNAALADTVALFSNATHNNVTTGVLTTPADYTSAWNTMTQKMREQKGLNSTEGGALNIPPRFALFPSAIRSPIRTALRSSSVAIATAGNAGTDNIWSGEMTPIEDAELAASSTGGSDVKHYLVADSLDVDTLEYAYLQGMPAPVIEVESAFNRLALRSRIYFAFALAPLDYRGFQQHTGA